MSFATDKYGGAINQSLRNELDDLWRFASKVQEFLQKGTVTIRAGGTTNTSSGAQYWDEIKKRSAPVITAATAFGDWQSDFENLAEHVQKTIDAHSAHPEWTVGVKTPLIDANANINLLPASGSALLIGEVGGAAGSARKFIWGDNPVAQADAWCFFTSTQGTAPTSDTQRLFVVGHTFTWDSASKDAWAFNALGTVSGAGRSARVSGIRASAVTTSSVKAPLLEGLSASAGTFTGSTANATLARAGAYYIDHFGSGTLDEGVALAVIDAKGTGTLTLQVGLDIPALTRGATNYGMRLAGLTHLLNGDQTWKLNGSYDWLLTDSSDNVLVRMMSTGYVGIGLGAVDPTHVLEVAQQIRCYKASDDQFGAGFNFKKSRGTYASPTAVLSGDLMAAIGILGYKASAWSGQQLYILGSSTQDWTNTACGSKWQFATTPNNSATAGVVLTLDQDASATFAGAVATQALTCVSLRVNQAPTAAGASTRTLKGSNTTANTQWVPINYNGTTYYIPAWTAA